MIGPQLQPHRYHRYHRYRLGAIGRDLDPLAALSGAIPERLC